jgi:hypothetical protein
MNSPVDRRRTHNLRRGRTFVLFACRAAFINRKEEETTMERPIMFYEVRPQVNRATGATILVPAIVEREEAVPLDVIIERAIDRGLIAGIKPSAAKQIADAIAQQMYEEFKAGRGVKFGNYFYARLYLDGTSDSDGKLTSANSINVARFLPQSFYYFHGVAQMKKKGLGDNIVVCVPSGNFGNICSALFGVRMGLPVKRMIAANNRNDVFFQYLRTGVYSPRPSIPTLANAMDV